jgi:hemolysin activation/secretion protein
MLGISYTFSIPEKPIYINRYKFFIDTGFLFGNRISDNTKDKQNIFELMAFYTANFNSRNSIYLKTTTQLLNSSNPFENELFRIGGINSIRGFNEQSILTPKYNVTTIEYHYATNTESYLYTITDFAILNNVNTQSTTQLYGLGLGYYLSTKRKILNLSYAVGTNYDTPFNISNSKIHIKISYPF